MKRNRRKLGFGGINNLDSMNDHSPQPQGWLDCDKARVMPGGAITGWNGY